MLLLADLSSSEWATLVGLLAVGAGGWVAVYVKLNRIEERLDAVIDDQKRIEQDGVRNWNAITNHEGQLQVILRMCYRVLRKLGIRQTDD